MSDGWDPGLDSLLKVWRQGDCIPGPREFVFRTDPRRPQTPEGREAVLEDPTNPYVAHPVEGFMVLTQTCDLVKPLEVSPFVEVSPLVTLPPDLFRETRLGARPRFVTVPPLHRTLQAADLDRTFTVEKVCLATWPRLQGCRTDAERRRLSLLLGRKRQRAALPDTFAPWFKPLRNRLGRLDQSTTEEGRTFQDLEEIRVQPFPSWDSASISVFLWFILKDGAPVADRSQVLKDWLGKLSPRPPIVSVEGRMAHYVDLLASEYRDSDSLDLDHLSPDDSEEGD